MAIWRWHEMKKITQQVLPYILFFAWVGIAAFTGMSIDSAFAETTAGAIAGLLVAGILLAIPAILIG